MKNKALRQNPMLAEMLIVLLFFALSACVLLGVFTTAYKSGERAVSESEALLWAEDLVERFALSGENTDDYLSGEGWQKEGNDYVTEREFSRTEYGFTAKPFTQEFESGDVHGFELTIFAGDTKAFTLPASNFIAGKASDIQ